MEHRIRRQEDLRAGWLPILSKLGVLGSTRYPTSINKLEHNQTRHLTSISGLHTSIQMHRLTCADK